MRLNNVLGAMMLAGIGSTSVATAVNAADLAPSYGVGADYGEPEQPLDFGSGWYLRGDATFGEEDRPKLNVAGLNASFSGDKADFSYGLGGGIGYKFNSFLRADITGDYLAPLKYNADLGCGPACDVGLQTKISRWDGLVNGYVDLGTWFGLTPYIGAGVGVASVHQEGSFALSGGPVPAALLDPRTGAVVTQNGAEPQLYPVRLGRHGRLLLRGCAAHAARCRIPVPRPWPGQPPALARRIGHEGYDQPAGSRRGALRDRLIGPFASAARAMPVVTGSELF